VLFEYEKWEICGAVLEGITPETRATLESMYLFVFLRCWWHVGFVWVSSLASMAIWWC